MHCQRGKPAGLSLEDSETPVEVGEKLASALPDDDAATDRLDKSTRRLRESPSSHPVEAVP